MEKYYCDVCNEWVDDMPLYGCYYYKNAICDATEKQCDAIRYIRADVALRYARMRERKGYEIAQDYGPHKCIYGADNTIVAGDDDIRWNTYEEAQQAWIKQNRGNVAQREA